MLNNLSPILIITCTYGRHSLLERAVRCFIDQDYKGEVTLFIYNNSAKSLKLEESINYNKKKIILVNNSKDLLTGENYDNVGSIFRDALSLCPQNMETCTFGDDDDIYFPNHLSEGMKGIGKAREQGKLAYKPYYSWFWYNEQIKLANNTTEPSIFVDYEHVKKNGFDPLPASFHLKWVRALGQDGMLDDTEGKPTLVYDWGSGGGAHKISGRGDDIGNFWSHKTSSTDHGDGVITPWSREKIDKLWIHVNNLIKT